MTTPAGLAELLLCNSKCRLWGSTKTTAEAVGIVRSVIESPTWGHGLNGCSPSVTSGRRKRQQRSRQRSPSGRSEPSSVLGSALFLFR